MADTGKMTDEEVVTYAQEQERISIGYNTDDVTGEEDEALKRYLGYPYGDEEDGRSKAVSMDASQVVDWALPDLLEPFVSGNRVVEFRPTKRSEEEGAKNATRYIDHLFWTENDGFGILHSAAKDGLIQKLGVSKLLWDESERTVEQTYTGQNSINKAIFEADEDVEVLESTSEPIIVPPEQALLAQQGVVPPILEAFPDGNVYTIKIEHIEKDGRLLVMSVPPEEFRISSRAAPDETPQYAAHTTMKTKGELIEMGFNAKKVEAAADVSYEDNSIRDTRFYNQPHTDKETQGVEFDWRLQKRWLHEEYIKLDYNRDGDQEIMQVFRVGTTLLGLEEVESDPFACFTPFPMPHSVIGQGIVDKVKQTARVKTVLTRKLLDGIYLSVEPHLEMPDDAVKDDGSTIDDWLNKETGSILRTKGSGGMIRPIQLTDTTATALQGLEYMNQVRELDSGVVRAPIGLSAEAIDKELSATEAAQIERGSMKRDKLMARVMAEMYLTPLFRKMLKFVQQYQEKPREIQLSGEWIMMDPRTWNTEMHAIPSVGLGHENRDSQAAAANVIGQWQEKLAQFGMVTEEQAWETAKDLTMALGKPFPEKYFIDPTSDAGREHIAQFKAQQAEQPDPATAQIQARAQLDAAKLQQDGQFKQLKLQQDGQMSQLKLQQDGQVSMAKAQLEQQTDVLKAQLQAQGNDEKALQEFQVNAMKAQQDFETKMVQIQDQTAIAEEKMNREFALAIEEQNREFFLALRGQNMKAEAAETESLNGSGGGGDVRFGGEIG